MRAVRKSVRPLAGRGSWRLRVLALIAVGAAVLAATTGTLVSAAAQADGSSTGSGSGSIAGNGLARTPIMGFNDWNAFGCNVSAQLIEQTADTIVSSGLQKAGYTYVDIDDCWQTSARSASGHLVPDPAKFPGGISAVAQYVHAKGLKLGIYESAGLSTCAGYPGSLGHETTDARDFASWGVDLLKYDNCGTTAFTSQSEYIQRYTTMAKALRATGRRIVFSLCEWGNYDPATWAPGVGNMWRTTGDIADTFASMVDLVHQNSVWAKYARPGAWNDPDMLEIGNGGMTAAEYRSEFSLWSMMAAPLIAGTDLRTASADTLAIYGNTDVIAVDQDKLGSQAKLISSANGLDVFARPLAGGDTAIALFNETDSGAAIGTTAKAAGVKGGGTLRLQDLWTKQVSAANGRIDAYVPAHSTVLYRVSHRASSARTAAQTALSATANPSVLTGTSAVVTVRFGNDGPAATSVGALGLSASPGWTVHAQGTDRGSRVKPGASVTRRFTVTAPAPAAPITSADLTASATYVDGAGAHNAASAVRLTQTSPLTGGLRAADTTGAHAISGENGSTIAVSAAGRGVAPAASTHTFRAAADNYAAVYAPGAVGTTSTMQAAVTVQGGPTGFGSNSASGIVVRNDMDGRDATGAPSPAGVALYVNSSKRIVLAWAGSGGPTVDTTLGGARGSAAVTLPVTLRLVRSGTTYTASYSTDGTTWTAVGTATLPASAAASTQDGGVFHTSGTPVATEADFTGLTVG